MAKYNTQDAFLGYFPPFARSFISTLLCDLKLEIKVTKPRKQRSGSFTVHSHLNNPVIRLNNDMKPYMFLVVFLHELAHFRNWQEYGVKIAPHGPEWRNEFRRLLIKVLEIEGVDEHFRRELTIYLPRIKATLHRDRRMTGLLNSLDGVAEGLMLSDIPENSEFLLPGGRRFLKLSRIRTRYRCFCPITRKYYLVPAHTQILIQV